MAEDNYICPPGQRAIPKQGVFGVYLTDPTSQEDINEFNKQLGCEQDKGCRKPDGYTSYIQIIKGWQIPIEKVEAVASQPNTFWQPKIELSTAGDYPFNILEVYGEDEEPQHDLLFYNLRISLEDFHQRWPYLQAIGTCCHESNTEFYSTGINQPIVNLEDLTQTERKLIMDLRAQKYPKEKDRDLRDDPELSDDEKILVTPWRTAKACHYLADRLPPWISWVLNLHAQYPLYQHINAYLKVGSGRHLDAVALNNFVKDIRRNSPEIHPEELFINDFKHLRQCTTIRETALSDPNQCETSYFQHLDDEIDRERECQAIRELSEKDCQTIERIPIFIGEFAINAPKEDRNPMKAQAYRNFFDSVTTGELAKLGIAGFFHFNQSKTEAGMKMHFDNNSPDPSHPTEVTQTFREGLEAYPNPKNDEKYTCVPYDPNPKYPELNFNQDLEYVVKYSKILNREIIEKSEKIQEDLLYAFKYELVNYLSEQGKIPSAQKQELEELFITKRKKLAIKELRELCSKHNIDIPRFVYSQINEKFDTKFDSSKPFWKELSWKRNRFGLKRIVRKISEWWDDVPAKPSQELNPAQVETLFRLSREVRYLQSEDGSGWEVRIGPPLRKPQIKSPYSKYLVKYTGPEAEVKARKLVSILLAGLRKPFLHRMQVGKFPWWKEKLKDYAETSKGSWLKELFSFKKPGYIAFNPSWYQFNVAIPQVTPKDIETMMLDLQIENEKGETVPLCMKNEKGETVLNPAFAELKLDFEKLKLDWKGFILDFTDKLYTAGIAPYAEETAQKDLEDAQNRPHAVYRDYKIARYKAWGDALFSLKKYDKAIEQYGKIVHFPYDAQHEYPLYFFEIFFNLADSYKIQAFIKNDPKIVEHAITELEKFPIGRSSNLGYQARATREIALLYQTLLEWEYRSLPLHEIHALKQKVRHYLALSLYLNTRRTKSKDFKSHETQIDARLKQEQFFALHTVSPKAQLKFVLPKDLEPGTTTKWEIIDDEVELVSRGETTEGEITVNLAAYLKDVKFENNHIFTAYYTNLKGKKIQFTRTFLIDPKSTFLEKTFPAEYPESQLSTKSKIRYDSILERWNYRVDKGEIFELAKTLVQMGDLYLNLSAEEEEYYDDEEKVGRLREAEKWFKLVIGNPDKPGDPDNLKLFGEGYKLFSKTTIDCACRNNLLPHQHKPKEFYLYRARAYWKLGEAQRRIAYITNDLEAIQQAVKNLEKALSLMSLFKRNAPSDFSIYDWIERHTYFEIRASLTSAYLYHIYLDASKKIEKLPKAEKTIIPAVNNRDLIEDINVKLSVMLALFETRLYKLRGAVGDFKEKLKAKIIENQYEIEEMLGSRAGGNSYLFNTYFKILEEHQEDPRFFTNISCTGSGYPYLRCEVDKLRYKTNKPKKVIKKSEPLYKLFTRAPSDIKLKLLKLWATALKEEKKFEEAKEKVGLACEEFKTLPERKIKYRARIAVDLQQLDNEIDNNLETPSGRHCADLLPE